MQVVYCRRSVSYTYYIGRGSVAGNPFTHLDLATTKASVQVATREDSIKQFELWLRGKRHKTLEPERRAKLLAWIATLSRDAVLGCYCAPQACHGDVIAKYWTENYKGRCVCSWLRSHAASEI